MGTSNEVRFMTTEDLQRIDELVHSADMAVRVASQLRLWKKRRTLSDKTAIHNGKRFIVEALQGGKFVATGEMASAASSLSPLTWSADIRFGFDRPMHSVDAQPQRYEELLGFLEDIRSSIVAVESDTAIDEDRVDLAANFFDQLGQLLGTKADNALRSPSGGTQMLQEHFSFQ